MKRIILSALAALLLIGSSGCDPLRPGKKLMAEGKYEEAAGFFMERTKTNPKDYLAYNELGFAYTRIGMPEAGLAAYKQAITIKPDFFSAYLNLGTLNMKLTQIDGAYYALLKAVELNPESEAAQSNLAWTMAANMHFKEAEIHRQAAIRLSGGKRKYEELAGAIARSKVMWEQMEESRKKAAAMKARGTAPQAGSTAAPQAGGTATTPAAPKPAPAEPAVPKSAN